MKLREIMSRQVIRVGAEEPVAVAARMLAHYNIGALPVCAADGKLCGILTDRDIVMRCIAPGKDPGAAKVWEIMTAGVLTADSGMEVSQAAALMGKQQVRRLPVVDNGKLCGMVAMADVVRSAGSTDDAMEALEAISSNISTR